MSGNPSSVGRKGSLGRYIGSRVQSNQKYCGPVMYQGQIWKINDEPCVKKVPRGESFNSGVGHIGAPRFLCNKNCKTDTQQTIFHAPIENGDKPLDDGLLGWDGSNVGSNGGSNDGTNVFGEVKDNGLWCEKPGTYQGGNNLFDLNNHTGDLINKAKMTIWISDLSTFITKNNITSVIMRLPNFSRQEPRTTPYKWDVKNFWSLMSGWSPDGTAFPEWPSDGVDVGKPVAGWPCCIFSFERNLKTGQTIAPFQPWTLASLFANHVDTNGQTLLKWLWLPADSTMPFCGQNPIISAFDTTKYGFDTCATEATLFTPGALAGEWFWNDKHDGNARYLQDHRDADLWWDTMELIKTVKYFATAAMADIRDHGVVAPLETGIIWELEQIPLHWSNYMSLPAADQSYSINMLVKTCHRCGVASVANPTWTNGLLDSNWTWGLTSYAKFGGLSGINTTTIIWAGWNYICQKVDKVAYNVELFVEWYGVNGKSSLENPNSASILDNYNTAFKAGDKAGETLMNSMFEKIIDKPFVPLVHAYQCDDPTTYDLFAKLPLVQKNILENLWASSKSAPTFINDFFAIGTIWNKLLGTNGSKVPRYTALISIEPFFMGGAPVSMSKAESGSDINVPEWNVQYPTAPCPPSPKACCPRDDPAEPRECTPYFATKWPIGGVQMKSWIASVQKKLQLTSVDPGSIMYFAQTYTMDAFSDKATYLTRYPGNGKISYTSYPIENLNHFPNGDCGKDHVGDPMQVQCSTLPLGLY